MPNFFDRIGGAVSFFFEETEVTRHVTIPETAGGITISSSGISDRHLIDIHAPGLISGSSAVIFFSTEHRGEMVFTVRLNSAPLFSQSLRGDDTRTWHKLLPAFALKEQSNELILGAAGDGEVTFSDVVILYRSNKTTMRKPRPVLSQ